MEPYTRNNIPEHERSVTEDVKARIIGVFPVVRAFIIMVNKREDYKIQVGYPLRECLEAFLTILE